MDEKSQLDIGQASILQTFTPGQASKRLPLFPESYGHFYAQKQYLTQRDWIDSYLLFYTIAGSGYMLYRDEEYILRPSSVTVIDCSTPQMYKTHTDPWIFKWIHFNGPAAAEYYRLLTEYACISMIPEDPVRVETYIDRIPAILNARGMHADVQASTQLINLFALLIESSTRPDRIPAPHREEINTAISFIEKNYRRDIRIDDLTSIIHMSKYYFIRTFRRYMGTTPYEYLIHYRINQSKILLKETTFSIDAISHQTGFGNVNNYIRHFKHIVGTTPAVYRKYWAI